MQFSVITYLLPLPFNNSEKTLHNTILHVVKPVRSSLLLVFFLQALILEPSNLLLQSGIALLWSCCTNFVLETLFTVILETVLLLGWNPIAWILCFALFVFDLVLEHFYQ